MHVYKSSSSSSTILHATNSDPVDECRTKCIILWVHSMFELLALYAHIQPQHVEYAIRYTVFLLKMYKCVETMVGVRRKNRYFYDGIH